MNRKAFLEQMVLTGLALGYAGPDRIFAQNPSPLISVRNLCLDDFAPVSKRLNEDFMMLQQWLAKNKWADFFKKELAIDFTISSAEQLLELTKVLSAQELLRLKERKIGFDDFNGHRLIEPGNPSASLLYHALASPRVKPEGITAFPDLAHIDILEDYIYALKKWENYQAEGDLVLAVFAYEYRPAAKTPHHAHADMVYSRTGIARIGEHPLNYDAVNRSFTNKPKNANPQEIAVMPARYGLFVARRVDSGNLNILSTGRFKGRSSEDDGYDDKKDNDNVFLLPVRKVFNNDLLFNESKIDFSENHVSEKLSLLLKNERLKKGSEELIEKSNPKITISSFLLVPKSMDLIQQVRDIRWPVDSKSDNRYFTTYSKKDAGGAGFFIETIAGNGSYRQPNDYLAARSLPMYVHLAHCINGGNVEQIPKQNNSDFENKIYAGGYDAPLYTDNLCDGFVSVNSSNLTSDTLKSIVSKGVFSAFSIVTAPDFFPLVDLFDVARFDVAPGIGEESNFFEGGIASLASARIRPNPRLKNTAGNLAFPPGNNQDRIYDTITAVVAASGKGFTAFKKDYSSTSFLPDVCSSVFAPGWDITYDAIGDDPYLSTQGLGSPFIEDMKLCAAMNGMWPVASPDAARTYQGTVTLNQSSWYANPTSIPLLDEELGFHANSSAVKDLKMNETTGWDGEQGPFLENVNGNWMVNFTDLGRADYVQNYLDGKFNMAILREKDTEEILQRMEALKTCIRKIDGKSVAQTKLWLISAERSRAGKFQNFGIPSDLFKQSESLSNGMKERKANSSDYFYQYVFARTSKDANLNSRIWAADQPVNHVKRRLQKCLDVYLCVVSGTSLEQLIQFIRKGVVV